MVICRLPVGPCEHLAYPATTVALVRLRAAPHHMGSCGEVSDRNAITDDGTGFGRRCA